MPSADGIRQLIVGLVSSQIDSDTITEDVTQDVEDCAMDDALVVSVHSPVNIHVYDAEGNHVGLAADNSIDEMIPGAAYEEVANNKFVYLPGSADKYAVLLEATATGTFSLRVEEMSGGVTTQTTYYHDIPIILETRGQMTFSENDPELVVDYEGDGQYEIIAAAAVLGAEESADILNRSQRLNLRDEAVIVVSFTRRSIVEAPQTSFWCALYRI